MAHSQWRNMSITMHFPPRAHASIRVEHFCDIVTALTSGRSTTLCFFYAALLFELPICPHIDPPATLIFDACIIELPICAHIDPPAALKKCTAAVGDLHVVRVERVRFVRRHDERKLHGSRRQCDRCVRVLLWWWCGGGVVVVCGRLLCLGCGCGCAA